MRKGTLYVFTGPSGAGKGILHFGNNRAYIIKGLHILICIKQHNRKSAYGKRPARNNQHSDKRNSRVYYIIHKSGAWVCKAAVEYSFLAVLL